MLKHTVIWDIDGTLADLTHRLPLLPQGCGTTTEQWAGFNKACTKDAPIKDNISLLKLMSRSGATNILLTGRGAQARSETMLWLRFYVGIGNFSDLIMRPANDHRPDIMFKEEAVRRIGLDKILCCFDDNPRVIAHLRSLGLTVHAVCDVPDANRKDLQGLGAPGSIK